MKRCIAALLCLCVMLSLCACTSEEPVKIKGNGQAAIEDLIRDDMSVEDARKLEDFERVQKTYMQVCELYEAILELDSRTTACTGDPLLMAPEYEVMLSDIDELVVQIMALKLNDSQYNQLRSMLQVWVGTDAAVYCQKMSVAISRNDAAAAADALVLRNAMYNDFTIISENIILVGSKIRGVDISEIEKWCAKHNMVIGGSSGNFTNSDNIPRPDPEWVLDPEIPQNYIPVPGENELYMVVDDDGQIEKYRHREQQEDGSWVWNDVNPDIPEDYIPVDGLKDVYKVTDKDGKVSYYKYIRNDDDTFAFVPVDKDGKGLSPEIDENDNHKILENYVRINGNIYAVYNEHNVCVGYKERRQGNDGKYYWVDVKKSNQDEEPDDPTPAIPSVTMPTIGVPDITNRPDDPNPTVPDVDNNPDTYTQIETVASTEIKGDWRITYKTPITKIYTKDGNLVSIKKDGPHEVSRERLAGSSEDAPDPSKIADTLQEEYACVSVGLTYGRDLAENVILILNADRADAGLPAMQLASNSVGQMLSDIRAADMAIFNHDDFDSPLYGTIIKMCERFGVKHKDASEAIWKTAATKEAKDIASRLQIMHAELFTVKEYSSIGLSIVQKSGYFYIDFVVIS